MNSTDTFANTPTNLLPMTYTPVSPSHPPTHISTSSEVSQNTAISDRPKAKPVSKKEGKNQRKIAMQVQAAVPPLSPSQQVLQMQQLATHADHINMTNFEMTPQHLERFMADSSFNHGCRGSSPQNIFTPSSIITTCDVNNGDQSRLANSLNPNQTCGAPTEELLHQAIHNILSNSKNASKDNQANSNISQHDSGFHRITMTPEELLLHIIRLEPSLSDIPPQELYHHVQHVLRDKIQNTLQHNHPSHQTVMTLQSNIEHLVSQHSPLEQTQTSLYSQPLTMQQHSVSANELQSQEFLNKHQSSTLASIQSQTVQQQLALLQQQHSLQKKKFSESDLVNLFLDTQELTDNKGYVLGDLSLEEFVRAMENFNVDDVTDSAALNLELPTTDPNLLEEAALAAKFVSTMAFLSPSSINTEAFEDKSLNEEKARQYQAGYHTAILMAKKHWPEAYHSVHQKIMSQQSPGENQVQSNKEMDCKDVKPATCDQRLDNTTNLSEQTMLAQQNVSSAPSADPTAVSNVSFASPLCSQHNNQVQVATQTQNQNSTADSKLPPTKIKTIVSSGDTNVKNKKSRFVQPRVPQEQQFAMDNNGSQYGGQSFQQTQFSCMDVDSETDSNHDTALTLACAGGHDDLVELLLSRGADIEHRDKKGFTPLILAATAGHEKVVDILLTHSADIEAQSERTKDTPLSLACSGGRYEVVELLLNRGANKEHRNVSDYTPLSLAASGGYVNIIKLLLAHAAEINSRTGSKLGISPLMLAAMNGHTAAVKLLLDMGSDINAQIETNRNTALTLACFQGRHEVVSLLLDRKANVEHRAKTGLTPLMEAASGGYVDVGRVLLDKGADVNATPVPSSRDTALTIAADKGHCRFVELLLSRNAAVEVKNKKGNSPLWLAANGGHLNVVELLYSAGADIDSQDNRKVSCLMAAFRKGHTKVVKWMVNHVTQFPSDQEMTRYICTISDKELLDKCHECVKTIRAAKDTQAAKANKNATILLEELDMEKNREESKKAAAARRRERKKKKKLEKKEEKRKLHEENQRNEDKDDDEKDTLSEKDEPVPECAVRNNDHLDKEEGGDSGIDANSQGSCSSSDVKSNDKNKNKKKKKLVVNATTKSPISSVSIEDVQDDSDNPRALSNLKKSDNSPSFNHIHSSPKKCDKDSIDIEKVAPLDSKTQKLNNYKKDRKSDISNMSNPSTSAKTSNARKFLVFESSRHPAEREDFEATGNETYVASKTKKQTHHDIDSSPSVLKNTSPKQSTRREEGWKEVTRKSSMQVPTADTSSKKVIVPLHAIARVIGRGGSNINAIRGATGAFIEIEKQSKGQGDRSITIKGPADALKQAYSLIQTLIKDSDVDIMKLLPQVQLSKLVTPPNVWEKPPAMQNTKLQVKANKQTSPVVSKSIQPPILSNVRPNSSKVMSFSPSISRTTAPRLAADKRTSNAVTSADNGLEPKTNMSYTSILTTSKQASKVGSSSFAEKLSEISTSAPSVALSASATKKTMLQPASNSAINLSTQISPKHPRTSQRQNVPPSLAVHCNYQNPPGKATILQQAPPSNQSSAQTESLVSVSSITPICQVVQGQAPNICDNRTPTPTSTMLGSSNIHKPIQRSPGSQCNIVSQQQSNSLSPMEYTLFKETPQQSMWSTESTSKVNFGSVNGVGCNVQASGNKYESNTPQVDVSKAPGYRGNAVSSPVGSKTSSSSTTPPCLPNIQTAPQNFGQYSSDMQSQGKPQPILQPITGLAVARPTSNNVGLSVTVGTSTGASGPAHSSAPPTPLGSMMGVQTVPLGQTVVSSGIGHSAVRLDQLNLSTSRPIYPDQRSISTTRAAHQHHSGNIASPGFDENSHMLSSYHHTSSGQNQHCNTTVTMSRLNPRASAFSSTGSHGLSKHGTQQQLLSQPVPAAQNQSGGCQNPILFNNPLYHQNQSGLMPQHTSSSQIPFSQKSSMQQQYNQAPRTNPVGLNGGFTPNRWPFIGAQYNNELGGLGANQGGSATGFCHLSSLGNMAPSGQDIGLENGGMVNMNSPSMSPISQTGHNGGNIEDRKIPRPIGTERAWKYSNHTTSACNEPNDAQGWMMGHHEQSSKQGAWPASHLLNPSGSYMRKQYDDLTPHERYQQQQQQQQQHLMTHQMQSEQNQPQYINPLMHSLPIAPPFLPGSSDGTCPLDTTCESWDPEKQSWGTKWSH